MEAVQSVPPLTAYEKLVQLGDICRVPDTLVIHAYRYKHPEEKVDIYWRDHGNGLRSIHFDGRITDDVFMTTNGIRPTAWYVPTNYGFNTFTCIPFASSNTGEQGGTARLITVPEYDVLQYQLVHFNGHTDDHYNVEICLPAEAIPRPVAYTGEPRIPQVHNS